MLQAVKTVLKTWLYATIFGLAVASIYGLSCLQETLWFIPLFIASAVLLVTVFALPTLLTALLVLAAFLVQTFILSYLCGDDEGWLLAAPIILSLFVGVPIGVMFALANVVGGDKSN